MIRKAATLYIACYLLGVILSGCCNCPPAAERTIRWTGLHLSSRPYTVEADSSIKASADTTTDFQSKQCLLRTTLDYQFIAGAKSYQLHLLNEAYACKCAEQTIKAQKSITNLRVFTINNFDGSHPAGSEITDRFGSPYILNSRPSGLGPLELYLPASQYQGSEPYTIYDLYLAKRPTAGSTQQFKVVVTFSDTTSYSELTPLLRF